MKELNNYIIEKLHLNKDYNKDIVFFELSDDELVKRMTDIIDRYNKEYNKDYEADIHYDKNGGKNPWRAQVLVNVSYAYPTCSELYKAIAKDYGSKEEYEEVMAWKYDDKNKKWIKNA